MENNKNSNEILEEEIKKGIKRRFLNGMDAEHEARLKHELPVIEGMGYADYHLIVKDFLEYARLLGYVPVEFIEEAPLTIEGLKEFIKVHGWKNPGASIGPGRGSAVGSLVCYLLGITNLDPMKYGLYFERFLNPERVSMPDIDSDFSKVVRGKVIGYVKAKYGEKAVCGIMTTTAIAPKGAINAAAKYYGLKTYKEPMTSLGRQMSKDVPNEPNVSFGSKVDNAGNIDASGESKMTLMEYLKNKYKPNKDAMNILHWAKVLEGTFTSYGSHAAGIVISDNDDVSEYLPLMKNKKEDMMLSQCDMVQVEENGLLKFDFLGLKTLDVINETVHNIEKNHGIIVDIDHLDTEDANIYKEIFQTGRTNSVFQFESSGMKAMLIRFKPECFEDIVILNSMFRPGPLQYLDDVINVKNGKKPMTFLCPQLEPITGKTYGGIVYQEQVMEICQKLAGFTLGRADSVRRFMSKKKADKLAHEREAFIEGCAKNEISEKIANELFDQMMDFASYAFNKSHAVAYSYNAYVTAWLKLYYPGEFLAAAINQADNKKQPGLVYEARQCGLKVFPPDINLSGKECEAVDGGIRFGLTSVTGVKACADEILRARAEGPFSSIKDFFSRVSINKTAMENLISAGAFDTFSDNRAAMKKMAEEIREILPKRRDKENFIAAAERVRPYIETATPEELKNLQTEAELRMAIDKPCTMASLEKRIESAKVALMRINKDLDLIRLRNMEEDAELRMALEKKFLGIYITKHPMDFYPKPEEIGATVIDSVSNGDTVIYGVVTDVTIKLRKSDGAKMAFFTLEDTSGSMAVAMFTKAYARYAEFIKDGKVLKLTGRCEVETSVNGDEIEETFKFFADGAFAIQKRREYICIPVASLESFQQEIEAEFKEIYADDGGYVLMLFDESTGTFEPMPYKVSGNALSLPRARKM